MTPRPPAAVREALEASGTGYRVVPRPAGAFRSAEVARTSGVALAQVVKTLVVRLEAPRFALALVPGDRTLSLPKMARAAGSLAAALATHAEATRVTGFPIGGITPLGRAARDTVVFADPSILRFGAVNVGGGRADLGIEMTPGALLRAVGARVTNITDFAARRRERDDGRIAHV